MRKQEYTSIEEIEAAYPDPGNETQKQRTTRLNTIRQAKSRLIKREQRRLAAGSSQVQTKQSQAGSSQVQTQQSQAGSSQVQTRSQTAANIVATQIQTRSRTAARGTTPQVPTRSKTTASNTLRKQKSRAALTDEQRERGREQDRIARQIRYATQQEQLRAQFLQIACCSIDDYVESVVEGDDIQENRHRLERMDQICAHCYALKWKGETKKFCCREGEIVLASLAPAPATLRTLLTNNDPNTNEPFVKKIRAYNSLFAFTSLGTTKVDKELADGRGGAYTFRLHGAMYHAI